MPKKLTQEEFLAKAVAVHGNRYDYSQTVYVPQPRKLTIRCPEHGIFEQSANNHISQGQGCPLCGKAKMSLKLALLGRQRTLTTADFVAKAQAVHGVDKYDYSQTVYINSTTKVQIHCPQHGVFEQRPCSHLNQKAGCHACGRERQRELAASGWVSRSKGEISTLYFLKIFNENEVFYKVGVTYKTVNKRYNSRGALAGYSFEVLAEHKSHNGQAILDWERAILETFSHLIYAPKLFFHGATECFSSCEEILAIFPL